MTSSNNKVMNKKLKWRANVKELHKHKWLKSIKWFENKRIEK